MFPYYKRKLLTIIWMGFGAALLSSMFSAIIIKIILDTNKHIKNLGKS